MTHSLTERFQACSLTTANVKVITSAYCDRFWIGNILKLVFVSSQNPVSTLSTC